MDQYNTRLLIERWLTESENGQAAEVTGKVSGLELSDPEAYSAQMEEHKKWIAPWLAAWVQQTNYCSLEDLFNMRDEELCAIAEKARGSLKIE